MKWVAWGDDFDEALLNALIATGFKIPETVRSVLFRRYQVESRFAGCQPDASPERITTSMLRLVLAAFPELSRHYHYSGVLAGWPERPNAENNVMKMIWNISST